MLLVMTLWGGAAILPNLRAQHAVEQIRDPEVQYQHAVGLYRRRFYDLAEPQLKQFLEKFPEHDLTAQVENYLIHCLREQQKTSEMLAALRQFRERWPGSSEISALTLLEAETLFAADDFRGAAECYSLLRKSQKSSLREQASYYLAQCQAKLGQADESLALYQELSDLPLQADMIYRYYALYHLAWIKQRQNDLPAAADGFARLVDAPGTPELMLSDSLFRLGEIRMALQQPDLALRALERYVVQFPQGENGSRARRYRIRLLASMENRERTLDLLQDWRDKFPGEHDFEMDYLQGQLLLADKRLDEALPFLLRVGDDPDAPAQVRRQSRLHAISCQLLGQQHAAAMTSIDAFLADYPKTPEKGQVLILQGEAAEALGKLDEAEQAYKAAMSFLQDEPQNMAQAGQKLANVLATRQKWAEGAEVLRKMASKNGMPNRGAWLLEAARFAFNGGEQEAAQKDWQEILRNFADEVEVAREARKQLMSVAAQQNDFTAAQQHAEILMQDCLPGEYGALAQSLAVYYYNQGDKSKAAQTLEQALQYPGVSVEQTRALQALYGRVLLEGDDGTKVRETFGKLLQYPTAVIKKLLQPRELFLAGEISEREGDSELAEQIWRRLSDYEQELVWTSRGRAKWARLCMARNRHKEAENLLIAQINLQNTFSGEMPVPWQELYSLLAEAQLQQKLTDQALIAANKALAYQDGDMKSLTRTRWVLAKILFEEENNPSQALSYAVKCFVLADDPQYTPPGMLLTVRIFLAQDRLREALATWDELAGRYPVWAERERSNAVFKAMLQTANGVGAVGAD